MPPETRPAGRPPLSGIIVVDMSDECLALTGVLLADLGATVIRVEDITGDALRRRGPFVADESGLERSLAHLRYNSGKLSVAADLESPSTWELTDRLTADVDLVIAPLVKPRAAAQYFDPEDFRLRYPGTGLVDIVTRRSDPSFPASDLLAVATGGLLYCNGFPDRPPDYPAGKLGFKQAAINAAAAAAALLLGQQRHGTGGVACVSLEEAVISTLIQAANQNLWNWYGAVGKRAGLQGLSYPVLGAGGAVALIQGSPTTFETRDGKWVVFGMTPFTIQRWIAFVDWLAELTGDTSLQGEAWHDATYRAEHRSDVEAGMRRLCGQLDRDELAMAGQARGLMVVPVNTVADIARDPHLAARGVFLDVEQEALQRTIPRVRSPFRSTAWEPIVKPAPKLGEHTRRVLEVASASAPGVPGAEPARAAAPHRERTARGEDALPLAGYRVVDFCWQAAGPLTTEMFANLGADVIKIESLKRVDTVRLFSHPMEHFSIDTGAFFNDCNTGKRSITLNLSTPEGLDIARRLIQDADVVTSNFTPGQMEDWGLGYEDLRKIKDDIVVLTLPVMGETGPKSGWRGIGISVVAMSGLAWHTGAPGQVPIGLGTLQTDFTVPLFAATAVMSALLQREATGRGQHIEIAQYESGLHLLDTELMDYLVNGRVAERQANRSTLAAPHGVFPCAGDDRWVAIEARSHAEFQQLCRTIDRPDLAVRADLVTLEGRQAANAEIEDAISRWTAQRPPEAAERTLRAAGIAAAALRHVGDLMANDAGLDGFFTTVQHPAGGPITVQNQPFTWNGRRLAIDRAPLLGEDNEAVLRGELGLSEEEFVDLMVREVVI